MGAHRFKEKWGLEEGLVIGDVGLNDDGIGYGTQCGFGHPW